MLDFLRNWTKSAEEKRQEALNAYLDGEMSPRERRRLEEELEESAALRAQLAQLRQLKASLQQLPRLRAPRNYTLDPAVYGAPQPQPAYRYYPVLRTATALAAFFFVLLLVLDLLTPQTGLRGEQLAMEPAAEEAAREVEVTRIISEVAEEGEAVEVTRVAGEVNAEAVEEAAEAAEATAVVEAEPVEEQAAEAEAEEPMMENEGAAAPATAQPTPNRALVAPRLTATPTLATERALAPEEVPAAPTVTATPPGPPKSKPLRAPLPLLLIAEVALGVATAALFLMTLLVRRRL